MTRHRLHLVRVIWPIVAAATWILASNHLAAAEWTQFRGPQGNGVIRAADHPVDWQSGDNIAWTTSLAGTGWSSPIIVDDLVFVTMAVSEGGKKPVGFQAGVRSMGAFGRSSAEVAQASFEVHCLRLSDGVQVWTQQLAKRAPAHKVHASNSYATESPVTDGQHVFVYFGAIGLVAALDMDGQLVWKKDVGAFPTSNNFGTGSSLTMLDGLLFVQCDNQESSFLLALDAATGKTLWKADRASGTCWSTPIIWRNSKRTELVVCGAGNVMSHDPSNGTVLWKLAGIDGSFSATPATDEDRIYFGNSGPGSRGPLYAVDAGATGDLSDEDVAWKKMAAGPGLASPVAHKGRLYIVGSRGILNCYSAESGERVYQARLEGAGSIAASPWIAGDKLFVLDEAGKTFVVQTGETFELLATNEIDDLFWSTPSPAGDSLLLRGGEKIYCVRGTSSAKTDAVQ